MQQLDRTLTRQYLLIYLFVYMTVAEKLMHFVATNFFITHSKKFRNILKKTPVLESFLMKFQAWNSATLLKGTPTQVSSCEYCEMFKNSFCYRTLVIKVVKKKMLMRS